MHYILPLRDVIAASVELMVGANRFDGLVMLCNCDKIVPGMLMAAARLDLPTIFVTGGPMASGRIGERDGDDQRCQGGHGQASPLERSALKSFTSIESHACPGPGACNFMGTASTMNCVTETLGLTLPRCATLPALHPERRELCLASGRQIVRLVEQNLTARQMLTRPAPGECHPRCAWRWGVPPMPLLHIPAIAHAAGFELDLDVFDKLSRQTPLIGKFRPASPYTVIDLDEAGGIPAVLNILSPLLHLDLPTVTGETIGERAQMPLSCALRCSILCKLPYPRGRAGHPARQPGTGWRGRQTERRGAGNAAPLGPARVFECEEDLERFTLPPRRSSPATCWSSATRGRAAGRVCVSCPSRLPC